MRILFASGGGYAPEFAGGVQSSTDHLARQCLAAGHDPAVLCALFGDGLFGLRARVRMKLAGRKAALDTHPGYPVMRAWFPVGEVGHAVARLAPDVGVVQCHGSVPLGRELEAAGVPVVVYLRNVEFDELGGDLRDLEARYIANSRFTARRYEEAFGIRSTVVPPTIDPALYRTDTTGEYVTFVNCYPEKGFERAVEIAAGCPDIPFLFMEGWKLAPDHLARVRGTLETLPNVTFRHRTSDMRAIYGVTRVLLAPSRWEEAWGRVASEAQCSGIPVLGSARGGLPEAIGPGGAVLPYDAPVAEWVAALRAIWDDPARYDALSKAAREHAARPALDPAEQFAAFMGVLEAAADGRAPGAAARLSA